MKFTEVAEIVGDFDDEGIFDECLADVFEYASRHHGIGFQFITDRERHDAGYEPGNKVSYTPCNMTFMAGASCYLPEGHEGDHRSWEELRA